MSDEQTTLTTSEYLPKRTNPYQLNTTLKPVSMRDVRERVDPQGEAIPAEDLIGQALTILEAKPFRSAFDVGREIVYWVKAVNPDGVLINTVLGGTVICDALDTIVALNAELRKAVEIGDHARADELREAGAGAPVTVTLIRHDTGNGQFYYDFE
jgi:hypothetical protein